MLALRVVGMVLMEANWQNTQPWEIRAMAGAVYETLPRWVRGIISEIGLADASMDEWTRVTAWYRKHNPRGTSLFPEKP